MKVLRISRLLLPLLFLLALPASAQATWTAPLILSESGEEAWNAPDVAIDPLGNAVFVWNRYDGSTDCGGGPPPAAGCRRVQALTRSAAGSLSAVQTLSPAGRHADAPLVGVDQSGNAFFVWQRRDYTTNCNHNGCFRIQIRVLYATGTLSPVQTLSGPYQHAYYPDVAVDQNGNAVVVWQRPDGSTDCSGSPCFRIETRTRALDGTLSAVQILSDAGKPASNPKLGVDSSGDAVFVWARDGIVQTRARSATGTLSAVQNLASLQASPTWAPFYLNVGVDQDGDAVFAWPQNDATTDCRNGSSCTRIQAIARSADGTLSSTQTLSAGGENASSPPQLAVDQAGNAIFVWSRYDGSTGCNNADGCLRAQTVFRSSVGALSAVQTLSPATQGAFGAEVGIGQNDNAVFVWQAGGVGTGTTRIKARTRAANGTLGTVQIVSGAALRESHPALAVNSSGNAAVSWLTFGGSTDCGAPPPCYYRVAGAAGP
jgi:hypothetical protein